MTAPADKARILAELRGRIDDKLETLLSSQTAAQAGAIHEETRQEDPKDTRAIEAQYLARGLAERVEALRDTQAKLAALRLTAFQSGDAVSLTALVRVQGEDGSNVLYFLAPPGCSERLEIDGVYVQVLTPGSPLGEALVGQCEGDEIEAELPTGRVRGEIVSVR